MEIRIYFEGAKPLRGGFKSFFRELSDAAKEANCEIAFIASKNGPTDFQKAMRTHPNAWNILLKDTEGPLTAEAASLCQKLGIPTQLVGNVYWMVELMESWFLADSEALAQYYGREFLANAIGNTANVENIPKAEVLDRLKRATRNTGKGEYHKTAYAPFLLERIDADRVRARAQNCRKVFDQVKEKLANL